MQKLVKKYEAPAGPVTSGALGSSSGFGDAAMKVLGSFGNGAGGGNSNVASGGFKPNVAGMIGSTFDFAGSFIKPKKEYEGEYGNITAGMDAAYDKTADALMNVPGFGLIAGVAMKGLSALGKGLGRLGGGTDGKTRRDAILGSNFFSWNVGLINGFGGKKSINIDKDYETWALAGSSYNGSLRAFDSAEAREGKYGKWSSSARRRANNLLAAASRTQNTLDTIMDENAMRIESLAQLQDMNNQEYYNLMTGGYDQGAIHAAKKGGILSNIKAFLIAHKVAYKYNNEHPLTVVDNTLDSTEDIDKFLNGGLMNLIPEGALHARKHNIEDVNPELKGEITHKGIPVVSSESGELLAEIEVNEIILNKELTDEIEELRKQYHEAETQKDRDEIARKAGELLAIDIVENTDDRTGLFKSIKV